MIQQAISAVSEHFKLGKYQLGISGGRLRILAACYGVPSMPPKVRSLIASALGDSSRKQLAERPIAKLDPIGYALIDNCWTESQSILHELSGISKEQVPKTMEETMGFPSWWNEVFIETIDDTIELIRTTCEVSKFVVAENRHRDKIANWTLWQRYHLKGTAFANLGPRPAHEDPFIWRRLCALSHLKKTQDGWISRIPTNWYSTEVSVPGERLRTRGEDALLRVDRLPRFVIRTAISDMQQYDRSELSLLPKDVEKNAKSYGIAPCLSAIPSRNGLGRVVFEEIEAAAVRNFGLNIGATLAAAMIFAALPPNLVGIANFRRVSSFVLIETPIYHPTKGGAIDGRLVRETESSFWRAIPLALGEALIALKATAIPEQDRESALNLFLKEIDNSASIARLRATLLFQVPVWRKVTEIYFNFGLQGDVDSIPGWRSYVTWLPRESQSLITEFIRRLDPSFAPDMNLLADLPACGSPFTPKLETVRRMYRLFESLCKVFPSDDRQWINHITVIAGLADFFYACFSFTRRIDASRPPMMFLDDSGVPRLVTRESIVVEKGFTRIIYVSTPAERVLIMAKTAMEEFENAAANLGWSIGSSELRPLAYYAIEAIRTEPATDIARVVMTKSAAAHAFHDYAPSHEFGPIPWQAMRDFASYVLRHSGKFSDWEIHHLLDHFDARSRSPLNRNSLRLPLRRVLNEEAAGVIYDRILGD